MKVGLDCHEADAQGGEVTVEVVVLGAGFVLPHAGVADPMVAALTAPPVAAGQICEEASATWGGRVAGGVKSDRGFLAIVEGGGPLDDNQAARSGQASLQGFEGINSYPTLVQASVSGVGFFGVGKRGGALAFCRAAW